MNSFKLKGKQKQSNCANLTQHEPNRHINVVIRAAREVTNHGFHNLPDMISGHVKSVWLVSIYTIYSNRNKRMTVLTSHFTSLLAHHRPSGSVWLMQTCSGSMFHVYRQPLIFNQPLLRVSEARVLRTKTTTRHAASVKS